MNPNPICPTCHSNKWDNIGSRVYSLKDVSKLNEYQRARYEVLFEVWLPGKNSVTAESILCQRCGFICFSPRPTSEELDKKYAFLAAHSTACHELNATLKSDARRSSELYQNVAANLKDDQRRLLDYGGGNGRLLGEFLQAGFQCAVVDYISSVLPGIEHLAQKIDVVPNERKFDVIICSHVLEHVSEPKEVTKSLLNHLDKNGLIYIEVPLEIWGEAPLPSEPVTHINFFTPHCLRLMCESLDLKIISCAEEKYTGEQGNAAPGIRLVARKNDFPNGNSIHANAAKWAMKYVRPTFLGWLSRYYKYPSLRKRTIGQFARLHLPERFFWRLWD